MIRLTHLLLLGNALCLPQLSAAEGGDISTKQIIKRCIQSGNAPCVVGVDQRTIIVNKTTYTINDKALSELESYYEKYARKLSSQERDRYRYLHNALRVFATQLEQLWRTQSEQTFWQTVEQRGTLDGYQFYLRKYPQGQFREFAEEAIHKITQDREVAYEHYARALEASRHGKSSIEIQSSLQEALKRYPQYLDAWFQLAQSQYASIKQAKNRDERTTLLRQAISSYDHVIELNADYAEALLWRGYALYRGGAHDAACRDFLAFQRHKHYLSVSDYQEHNRKLRLSKEFLEYAGCESPLGIDYDSPDATKYQCDDRSIFSYDLEVCAISGSLNAAATLASRATNECALNMNLDEARTDLLEKGVFWAERLYQSGDVRGVYYLSQFFGRGCGKAFDLKRADQLLSTAANAGYPPALKELGERYLGSMGIKPDLALAKDLLQRAAAKGYQEAQWVLDTFDARADGKRRLQAEMPRLHSEIAAPHPDLLKVDAWIYGIQESRTIDGGAISDLLRIYGWHNGLDFHALSVLGSLEADDSRAVPVLREILKADSDKDDDPERIHWDHSRERALVAISALAQLRGRAREAIPDLIARLDSSDRLVRLYSATALTKIDGATDRIRPLQSDTSGLVRSEVKRLLVGAKSNLK